MWGIFRKYHYLNTSLHQAAAQYVGILNDETLVCHTGVIQAAMKANTKRVHRLVVLPEYQGLGIGTKFINFVADLYAKEEKNFNLITTTPALRYALEASGKWELKRAGKVRPPGNDLATMGYKHLERTFSCNRITYSFNFKQ